MKILYFLFFIPILGTSQWTELNDFLDDGFTSFTPVSEQFIAITSFENTISQTFNGGENWEDTHTMFVNSWFLDIDFPSQMVGYACGGTAFGEFTNVIAKTTNGGQSWESLTYNEFAGYNVIHLSFLTEDLGVISAEVGLMLTQDGGESFTPLQIDALEGHYLVSALLLTDTNLFVATRKVINYEERIYNYQIFKSSDLGTTWTSSYSFTIEGETHENIEKIRDFYFVDDLNGYAVGSNGIFLKTSNGGISWQKSYIANSNLTTVQAFSPDIVFTNINGGISVSTDGGQTWQEQLNIPEEESGIIQMKFINENVGFAITTNKIFKTSNAGGLATQNITVPKVEFNIYPNPSQDFYYIQKPLKTEMVSSTIYDTSGKIVKIIKGNINRLDLSHLPQGEYFIQFETTQGTFTKKLLKK